MEEHFKKLDEEIEKLDKMPPNPKDMKEHIKTLKGAFDIIPGGTKLNQLSSSIKGSKIDTLDSLKAHHDRLLKEYQSLPLPKGDIKIKRKRYYVSKKIKDIEKQLAGIQKAVINKDPIDLEECEKYENLSKQIGYKHTPMGLMDRVQFEIEKKNILDKADKIFNNQAKVISEYVIMMSHITDNYESIAGYSLDLTKGQDRLQLQVKKCLIHEGMKGNQFSDAFSNPYIGLSMALAMPLMARYSYNKSQPEQKKISDTNEEKSIKRSDPIKVDMGNINL